MPAKPDQIKAEITLEIDSDTISPEKFFKGVRAFFGLLDAVTKDVAGPDRPVRWNVRVLPGSALIGVEPPPANVDRGLVEAIKSTLQTGVDVLEKRATVPEHFPDTAMRHLYNLASLVSEDHDVTRVRLWVKRTPKSLTHHAVANVRELIGGVVEDIGSVEGRLRVVAERGGLQFIVDEPIHNAPIRCYMTEEVLPKALAAFRKRVEVFGSIRYRRDGTPISITVTDLVEFPPPESIPDFRSVRGALREPTT